jgi:hypothetical protein
MMGIKSLAMLHAGMRGLSSKSSFPSMVLSVWQGRPTFPCPLYLEWDGKECGRHLDLPEWRKSWLYFGFDGMCSGLWVERNITVLTFEIRVGGVGL